MNDLELYSAAACRDIDIRAMEPVSEGGLGVSGQTLMQRAAQFALESLMSLRSELTSLTILCGKGNNAGDGYLVAMLARQLGIAVQLIAVEPKAQLSGDALSACQRALETGIKLEEGCCAIRYPVIVDALLGTGARGTPRPAIAQAIHSINASDAFTLSLDLPSGLNADTGEAQLAVRADATVSFIARKIGLYTGKGPAHSGQRLFSDIGVAEGFAEGHASVPLRRWHSGLVPRLPVEAYKHQRGHVVVVGGSKGMGGAVVLAAEAALRSGVGMVTVATAPENLAGLLARLPEAMWVDPLSSDQDQSIASVLSRASVVVLGPGLGRGAWATQVLDAVSAYHGPLVIDADGLYWLADRDAWHQRWPRGNPLFLTPHGAEAARLLDRPVADVMNQTIQSVADMAERYNATCLLKGPGTVMGDQQSQAICGHGNPGMATAGMGDVLAGLAASLIAQQPEDMASAFYTATLLHSAAGDLAAQEMGERAVTATAVIPRVAALLQELPSVTG